MCGRLVAGRRPDVFARRMASQTCSRASSRRQAARLLRIVKSFTNHTPNGKVSTFGPPERSPKFGQKYGAAEGGSQGAAGLHPGAISGEKWGSRKGCKLAKPKKKRGSQSDQADFYNTKKEPRNVKASPPTAFERKMALQIKLRGASGRRQAARRLRMANGFTNNNVRGSDGN